jgi:hypothetical protein
MVSSFPGQSVPSHDSPLLTIAAHRLVRTALLLSFAIVLHGCSHTFFVVKDHVQALRQDDASLTVILDDSSTIRTPAFCHVYDTVPDGLLSHLDESEAREIGLSEADVSRLKDRPVLPDARGDSRVFPVHDSLPQPRSLALWGKGILRMKDGREAIWFGGMPVVRIRSVEIDNRMYIPLTKLQAKLNGPHRAVLRDGTELVFDSAQFKKDSCILYSGPGQRVQRVALPAIDRVERVIGVGRQTAGAVLGGALAGIAAFGLGSTLLWYAIAQPYGENKMAGLWIFVYLGSAGAILGPVMGITNMQQTYRFLPSPP